MSTFLSYMTFVFFGLLGLVLVVDFLEHLVAAIRCRLHPADTVPPTQYSAGFSLRRTGSALRERHYRKLRPTGRTAEISKIQDDPYDV